MAVETPWVLARRKARALLWHALEEEQRRDLALRGGFRIRGRGRLYWLRPGGAPVCADLERGTVATFCVAPDEAYSLPPEDIALTFLIWLTAGEHTFWRRATVASTRRLPPFETEDDLIEVLAPRARISLPNTHPATVRPQPVRLAPVRRSRARPAARALPEPLTEAQRARVKAEVRNLLIELRVRSLQQMLNRGPDDVAALRRVAEDWRPLTTIRRRRADHRHVTVTARL